MLVLAHLLAPLLDHRTHEEANLECALRQVVGRDKRIPYPGASSVYGSENGRVNLEVDLRRIMETLWAPWRMTYIEGVDDESPGGCFLCAAGRPELGDGDLVVHRAGAAVSLLNRYPYNPGHLMVAPRSHVGDLAELDPAEMADVASELRLATAVLKRALACDGFNGGWNQGRIAGAGVDRHLHFHLVPRWSGDTNFMAVLADVKVVPEHLEATRRKLLTAFAEAT